MYVCLCRGVTDHDIRRAVLDGAQTIRAVRSATNAMTQCGKCACLTKSIIDETLSENADKQRKIFYEVA
ncbi:MAG: (2Fe-2S)-binding protein [Cellvibrionaceae bacterium]|nr:(2Fe-2S)-binding protein [Cellvibrionaceae bacterium]